MTKEPDDRSRVVIVGAGFGGLWAVRGLAGAPADVVVLDRSNYHTFFPLLYQVAAAEIGPTSIAYPVRSILRRQPDAHFRMTTVRGLDLNRKLVLTDEEPVPYDYLILALGSVTHFLDVEGARQHAFPLRWMDDAVRLRHHVLSRFERAVSEKSAERRARLLTFVMVGGGHTGVEFSGALSELIRGPLLEDYHDIRPDEVHIMLLEARERLLPGMTERLGRYAERRLRSRGLEVRLGARAERVTADTLQLADGTAIPTETVVWTAGVRGQPGLEDWGLPLGPGGRVRVGRHLSVPGRPEVYVVGDLAYLEVNGEGLPMVAPVATQQGELAARNILRQIRGERPVEFEFGDPGMLAVIGRNDAVAELGRRSFTGSVAWLLWLVVHIAKLIGFRSRALVLVNWAWNYVAFRQAVRLILPYRTDRSRDRDDPG